MIMKFHPRDNRQEQRSHQIGIDYGEENNGFVNSLANKIFVLKTSCKFTSSSFFFMIGYVLVGVYLNLYYECMNSCFRFQINK